VGLVEFARSRHGLQVVHLPFPRPCLAVVGRSAVQVLRMTADDLFQAQYQSEWGG
jgi:hypothetical protein